MADGADARSPPAFAPRPITYRTIDFRTNEFRGLEGGDRFEPEEANPMIGYRGALRYIARARLFALELEAIDAGLGRGPHELPRDAAVRPHRARAGALPRRSSAESRPARPRRASSSG